jgi:hypothetical protein
MAKLRFTEQSIPVHPVASTTTEEESIAETVQESALPPVVKRRAPEKPRRLAARVGKIIALFVVASGVSSYLALQNEKDTYVGLSGTSYKEMLSKDTALYSLANIRFKLGDLKGAGNIAQEIEIGNSVDPRRRSELVKNILNKYIEKKEYIPAFDLSWNFYINYVKVGAKKREESSAYLPMNVLNGVFINNENVYSLLKNAPEKTKPAIIYAILNNQEKGNNDILMKNSYIEILGEIKNQEERDQWRMRKMSSLFSEKKVSEAKEIFSSIEKAKYIDDYRLYYIGGLSENGLISEALEEAKKIDESKRISYLGTIGTNCIQSGNLEEAKKIFFMIRSILPEPEKIISENGGDRTTCNFLLFDIIKAEYKLGNTNSVRRFSQMVTDKSRWEEFIRRSHIVLPK